MPHTVVIFGASGDLTSRKLIPALYLLHKKKRLPPGTRIVGVARSDYGHDQWRSMLEETTKGFEPKEFEEGTWKEFAAQVFYFAGDGSKADSYPGLMKLFQEIEPSADVTRVYYLSTKPDLYAPIVTQLSAAGLVDESKGPRRIIIEKPFGTDQKSAEKLNHSLHELVHESQMYRIDHYLGKETVQNLLVLRFANMIFEPLWNRNYIEHVQITAAEEVHIGSRAGYYDTSGVLRDMFQNHLLQLMMITAMEAPAKYNANLVRDEKVKVLRSIRPFATDDYARDTFRGQYDTYLKELEEYYTKAGETSKLPAKSHTATFAALKLHVDNWRWHGVPFYLRSGKNMSCRTTQIVIQFREPPYMLFSEGSRRVDGDRLVIQVQPAEGIQLQLQSKVPDQGMRMRMTDLDFRFAREFKGSLPDAYQRLILDAMNGDASLFARSDEVELAWGIIDPILAAWETSAAPPLDSYTKGEWGPDSCARWMQEQGRSWFDVCPVLH